MNCEDHGTWSGAYWAMFESRLHDKIGTNGYGPVLQNWTDNLGYWLNSSKLISFAREVIKSKGGRIENQEVIDAIIRKTKCSRVLERNVIPRKTKRSFSEIFSTGLRRFMSCAETGFGHHPNPVRFVASLPL